MTTFVTWPVEIDAAFRAAYADTVQEAIEDSPRMNAEGTHYIAGSSRIDGVRIGALGIQFPTVSFGQDIPDWWVDRTGE